jgi:hypothetical protein
MTTLIFQSNQRKLNLYSGWNSLGLKFLPKSRSPKVPSTFSPLRNLSMAETLRSNIILLRWVRLTTPRKLPLMNPTSVWWKWLPSLHTMYSALCLSKNARLSYKTLLCITKFSLARIRIGHSIYC